jgi:hypothetical protein
LQGFDPSQSADDKEHYDYANCDLTFHGKKANAGRLAMNASPAPLSGSLTEQPNNAPPKGDAAAWLNGLRL